MSAVPEERRARRNWTVRLIVLAVVLALLVVFVAENFSEVEVRLFVTKERTRLAWALLIASTLGFVIGYITARARKR
jgi:uncharacterized integral membrane protein